MPALTSLRFFAAVLVVLHHFFTPFDTGFISALILSGYEYVVFFFVLSGFILSYVYSGERREDPITTDTRTFLKARFARIAPAYGLGLLLALPQFAYAGLITQATPLPLFVASLVLVLLFLQAWWPPTVFAWNGPAWSLSVEALFYASFPLASRLMARLKGCADLFASLTLILIMGVLVYTFRPAPDARIEDWVFIRYFPLFLMPLFLFGMSLGRLFVFERRLSPNVHLGLFVAGLGCATFVIGARYFLPGWLVNNAVLALAFGAMIYGGAGLKSDFPVLTSRPLVVLGEASYALYIIHFPLIFWWRQAQMRLGLLKAPPLIDFLLFTVLAVTLSVLCLYLWENPLRRKILKYSRRRAPQAAAAPVL